MKGLNQPSKKSQRKKKNIKKTKKEFIKISLDKDPKKKKLNPKKKVEEITIPKKSSDFIERKGLWMS